MRTSTSIKLAIAGIVAVMFAGFLMRAAARLASVAMHSLFTALLLLAIAIWLMRRTRS